MSKRPLESDKGHFRLDQNKLPKNLKKVKGYEIEIWFKYGTVGSGTTRLLIDDKYQYVVQTGNYWFAGNWQSFIIEMEKL